MDSTVAGAVAKDQFNKLQDDVALPGPATSMIYFLLLTIIYGFLMIFATLSSSSLSAVISNSNSPVFTLIYIIFLISGTYFINVNISKNICMDNTIQWFSILGVTILPWLIIFGMLFMLLELFPGWINPFSNTVGFMVVNALGATQAVKQMLKPSGEDGDSTLKKALENVENNYSRFINEIDPDQDNYTKFVRQLYKENFINGNSSDSGKFEQFLNGSISVNLFALINAKKLIGKLFWYILAGTLIASISYNYIINMSCEKSADQSAKEYDELYENSSAPVYGKKWQRLPEEPPTSSNQDYTTQLSVFITNHSKDFFYDGGYGAALSEVEFTKHQLNLAGMSYDELPANSYIQIVNNSGDESYFRPIA